MIGFYAQRRVSLKKGRIPELPTPARVTVLVVDDDQDVRTLARLALEYVGYVVFEAADGIEAWETIGRERPALAVVDVQMPRLDGLKLCARVKRDGLPN